MHVLAIYRVNEHLAELLAESAAERQARESRPKAARAFRILRFRGRPQATPVGATTAFANS